MRRMYGSSGRAPQRFLPIARRDAGRRQRDKDRSLHLLKPAFIGHDAFPCGYSTSGQICSVVGLIAEGKANSTDEIRKLVSGNICRRVGECTNRTPAIGTAMGSRVHEFRTAKLRRGSPDVCPRPGAARKNEDCYVFPMGSGFCAVGQSRMPTAMLAANWRGCDVALLGPRILRFADRRCRPRISALGVRV